MRLQLLSDLHLERYADFMPRAAPQADALILAGDIGSYQSGSLLPPDDFGLVRFSPVRGAPWKRVFFLPGNHEYDDLEHEATRQRLRSLCAELGIEWLDREVVRLSDDCRLLGCTLWTDFEALAARERTLGAQLKARDKAFRAANFYLSKNTTLRAGAPLLAEDLRELGLQDQQWLRRALAQPFEGRTVVVTHFAPTLRSADPRYGLTPGTAGFCNALDDLLMQADVWMHGHLHCFHDYAVTGDRHGTVHQCRVVANPRGYRSKGEQEGFREGFVVDVASGVPSPR